MPVEARDGNFESLFNCRYRESRMKPFVTQSTIFFFYFYFREREIASLLTIKRDDFYPSVKADDIAQVCRKDNKKRETKAARIFYASFPKSEKSALTQ